MRLWLLASLAKCVCGARIVDQSFGSNLTAGKSPKSQYLSIDGSNGYLRGHDRDHGFQEASAAGSNGGEKQRHFVFETARDGRIRHGG